MRAVGLMPEGVATIVGQMVSYDDCIVDSSRNSSYVRKEKARS